MDESGGGAIKAQLFWQRTVDMSCFFLVPFTTTRHTPPVIPLLLRTLTPRTTNALPHVRRSCKLGDVSHAELCKTRLKKTRNKSQIHGVREEIASQVTKESAARRHPAP